MRVTISSSLLLLASLTAQASYIDNILAHVELSGAGGMNWLNSEDTHLVISSTETDLNKLSGTTTKGTWKLGIGYELFEEQLRQRSYFNRLLLELNVYQASNTIEGNVWQYELPQFNNYTFDAPIPSTRLMLDVKPSLITWNRLSPYLILGVGASWNKVSYDETALAGIDPSSALSLSEHTQTQLAWDLGVGLNIQIVEDVSLTAEYIYGFLGEGSPDNNSGKTPYLSEPPSFSYQIQSLLIGLSVKY